MSSKVVKNQILALSGQVLPAALGMVSFMWLVRILDPKVLGEYLIYMTSVVLFEMVKSGGLQSALVMKVSDKDPVKRNRVIGSAYWLGGIVVSLSGIILLVTYFLPYGSEDSGFKVFCLWYSVLGIITLPLHIAEAEAVADQNLIFLLLLRILQSINPLIVALFAFLGYNSLQWLATVHVGVNVLLLFYVLISKKTNPALILKKTKEEVRSLVNLIKYTLATLGTTNILKSADTFLIGSFLGPTFVALYAIPQKLTELFEIPLRTLSTTAFPQLAAHHNARDKHGFNNSFISYLTWAYILYIPGLILAFILAPFFVLLIGGEKYANSADIFRVFVFFGAFLPLNRITGIVLDAIQKPGLNFLKVATMASVNIIADVAALYFSGDLRWVAFASVVNAATGCFLGLFFIKKAGVLNDEKIMPLVVRNFSEILNKVKLKLAISR